MKQVLLILFLLIMAGTVFAQTSTKSLAVATFDITGNAVAEDEADAITELFIAEMVSTGSVKVVDRSNFEKILTEMNFQSSDWSDSGKTVQLGTSINADIIARGKIIKLGSKLYLSATIIDSKTAIVLSSSQVPFTQIDDIFGLLPAFCAELTKSLSVRLKIGDKGLGGGVVFHIEGDTYLECSKLLGKATWTGALTLAKNYRGGGYTDWYLPTREELNYIYENLRAKGFESGGDVYWSSSETSSTNAWGQRFRDGGQNYTDSNDKTRSLGVRAVRAFNSSSF